MRVETDHNLEPTGMECKGVRLVLLLMVDLKVKSVVLRGRTLGVRPDLDGLIERAGGDEVLLDANVHA